MHNLPNTSNPVTREGNAFTQTDTKCNHCGHECVDVTGDDLCESNQQLFRCLNKDHCNGEYGFYSEK